MILWRRAVYNITRRYASSGHGDHANISQLQSMWKKVSFFVGLPAIGVAMVNAYLAHMEELQHEPPEFVAYEHMRLRTKPFPWGDGNHSFFHNPRINPLPTGYEDN